MPEYDIFLSYSSKDSLPQELCRQLEKSGARCWMAPRDISPGVPYARAIMQGMNAAKVFVVFISRNSLQSDDVLNEIDNAHGLKKTIIPVFLEDVSLTPEFSYYLKRRQWINYFSSGADAVRRIFEAIGLHGTLSYSSGRVSSNRISRSVLTGYSDKALYRLVLESYGDSYVNTLLAIQNELKPGIVESKRLIDNLPAELFVSSDKKEVMRIYDSFAVLGVDMAIEKQSYIPSEYRNYAIYLVDSGHLKLVVVKYVKEYLDIGLQQAKLLVDSVSKSRVFLKNVTGSVAVEKIRMEFAKIGATIESEEI